jgi:phospholipase C
LKNVDKLPEKNMPNVDPRTRDAQDPIKHVVLLLLENRSFDQMLGSFKTIRPDLEGIDPNLPPRTNHDNEGNEFKQVPTESQQMPVDPRHEKNHVLAQLANDNAGFVQDFVDYYGATAGNDDRQLIMSYYPQMFLPALHRMARDFTICDHWFSSVPGPTWPNRFFALSGTASGRVDMPDGPGHLDLDNLFFRQDQTTLFDRLNDAGRSWKIYFYDFPSSLILTHQRHAANLLKYHKIDKFFQDTAHLKPADFPDFALIEPKYSGQDQNDDHPPHNIMKGEKLIADVYNALRSNEELWKETLLVILFDEHGGFFDHVSPPAAVPPDEHQEEYTFDRLGVRVPAVLVSPWVGKRVEQTQFDHTSLLKYLINKWSLGSLGERTAAANSVGIAISEQHPRTDTLPFVRISTSFILSPRPDLEKEVNSDHQIALQAFADYLRRQIGDAAQDLKEVANPGRFMKSKAWLGNVFLRMGTSLTKDLDVNNQERIELATDTVIAYLKGEGESTVSPTEVDSKV